LAKVEDCAERNPSGQDSALTAKQQPFTAFLAEELASLHNSATLPERFSVRYCARRNQASA